MLQGCLVAIVTPMFEDGSLDLDALRNLIDFHIKAGTDGIVIVGTSGESPTVTVDEHCLLIKTTVEHVAGRVAVIAGTGANSTNEAIELTQAAKNLGVDACLLVTPYYNKPTQEGMYQHFRAIAENTELPIILYNVPGRCGVNMEATTTARIAKLPNILGTKEASGNISQISEVISLTDASFLVFAGDDSVALPTIALGGVGVISVASNLLPREVSDLSHACLAGDWDKARKLNRALTSVFKNMFIESNPAPVKAAMAAAGLIGETLRLPMVPITDASRAKLEEVLAPFQLAAQVA